jgi:hypothetical protein
MAQCEEIMLVTLDGLGKPAYPAETVRLRRRRPGTVQMTVPKAAVNEHRDPFPAEHNVGRAG